MIYLILYLFVSLNHTLNTWQTFAHLIPRRPKKRKPLAGHGEESVSTALSSHSLPNHMSETVSSLTSRHSRRTTTVSSTSRMDQRKRVVRAFLQTNDFLHHGIEFGNEKLRALPASTLQCQIMDLKRCQVNIAFMPTVWRSKRLHKQTACDWDVCLLLVVSLDARFLSYNLI